ncbi:histidine phosphatase family protein [Flavobacterium terrigena]|uniref:Alpha-ribazole phosphatase n=1 Tax=Flavobacterium terrigena TaxID=402734 RepID=A0A1H6QW39_9FLAO|nr:histidine phosphatase family protein [Flavobacterium terrigena]SEI46286.1 alpha-ribazole phosphatase [Flavobacterium terrigena]
MEIYLVRHTEPVTPKGICYGQADVDIKEPYLEIFQEIKAQLPTDAIVYSSPLLRCKKMAEFFTDNIIFDKRLMEMNFGNWELKAWNDIPLEEINPWMDNFVTVSVPNGESFKGLHQRVGEFYTELLQKNADKIILFCHDGAIRSILSHYHKTQLKDSFSLYTIKYGEVVKIIL